MNALYFEPSDGISGDMTLAALIDLGVDAEELRRRLCAISPEPFELISRGFERNGIRGINLDVIVSNHDGDGSAKNNHLHRHYSDIAKMIEGSGLSNRAKRYSLDIFSVIAEAEAAVHGMPKDDVAFHEVGAMDSIIDIIGTAIAVDMLNIDGIFCSVPHDGAGWIKCRHGEIPVPVPAVMEMARGAAIPIMIDERVKTEMVTPTGFGILKGLKAKYDSSPEIVPLRVGYGFGKRETGRLGALRVTLAEHYIFGGKDGR